METYSEDLFELEYYGWEEELKIRSNTQRRSSFILKTQKNGLIPRKSHNLNVSQSFTNKIIGQYRFPERLNLAPN